MTNLLRNGNLQAPWDEERSHDGLVNWDGDTWVIGQFGNIFNPPGWTTWFRHRKDKAGFTLWAQPEVSDAWAKDDPDRALPGNAKGIKVFCSFKPIYCGMFQRVTGVAGKRLLLTAYAHGWTNHDGWAHSGDGNWCLGSLVGDKKIALNDEEALSLFGVGPKGSELRARNDANIAARFTVGFGTAPDPEKATWSPARYVYNGYVYELSITFDAPADAVYIWVRQELPWAFRNNDGYWGGVSLVVAGDTVEPEPDPDASRGAPRLQYPREYVLIPPQGALSAAQSRAWWVAAGLACSSTRRTFGGSADDAGVGDLDQRTVLAVNPTQWGDLNQFYAAWYPGVILNPVIASTPSEMVTELQPPLGARSGYSQRDGLWAGEDMGEEWGGATIGQEGCFLTSYAWVVSKRRGRALTPPLMNQLLALDHRAYSSDNVLSDWDSAVALFPAWFERPYKSDGTYYSAELAGMLALGFVILKTGTGLATHFVALEKVNPDGTLSVMDPLVGALRTWTVAKVNGVRGARFVGYSPLPEPPDPEPPTPPSDGSYPILQARYGVPAPHVQTWDGDVLRQYIAEIRPAVVKVFSIEDAGWVLEATGCQSHVVVRMDGTHPSKDVSSGPQEWVNRWRDSLNRNYDLWKQRFGAKLIPGLVLFEEPNEWIGGDFADNQNKALWSKAFIRFLPQACPGWAPAIFCVPVGNPPPEHYYLWTDTAKELVAARGAAGYHSYHIANRMTDTGRAAVDWPWLPGRWQEIDKVWSAAGAQVAWYAGEAGAINGTYFPPAGGGQSTPGGTYWLDSSHEAGWRGAAYHGNWDPYAADMDELTKRARAWGKRFWGWAEFTVGSAFVGWESFKLRDAQWQALKATMSAIPLG